MRSVFARLLGREELPEDFAGTLAGEERVLALAPVVGGGHVVVTSLGMWLPEGRRVSWHLLSKATWSSGTMGLVEADEVETLEGVVLLADRAPRQLRLAEPGRVPQAVHERVTGSVRSRHHRDLPGGGAWFVQRKVPGRDGVVLQVRPDPGTDPGAVRRVAAEVGRTLRSS
ncbi:hypothetical protein [Pseudonocardia sp.]|uniref:hypothetical protein n=1 Tax=Pseudonocardia sp. TaxID=60912 RepID=UPI003D0AF4C7